MDAATGLATLELLFVAAGFLYILYLAQREWPSERNVRRWTRVFRGRASRTGTPALRLVEKARRELRPLAVLFVAFVAVILFAEIRAALAIRDSAAEASRPALGHLLALSLPGAAALVALAYAFWSWGPVLLERVRLVLESESLTTNRGPT